MKRKMIIAGIFFGLAAGAIVVVLATRQDTSPVPARKSIRVTAGGQIIVEPPPGRVQPTVVAHFKEASNAAPSSTAK